MDEFTGRSVKITLEDGDVYNGFVHSFNTNSGKLSLEKVTSIENGEKKRLVGLQHFFSNEIVNIVATEEVVKSKSKNKAVEEACSRERRMGHSIMKPKFSPAHLSRLRFLDPSSLVLKNSRQDSGLTSSGNETESSDSDSDNVFHPDYTVLGKMNSVFQEAIKYIRKHQVIGMGVEGVSIGRSGKLCWLQIAVPDHVFLFDILRLGSQAFDDGLTSVIEDEDIQKVLHDCRMVSDILHNQYSVSLVNVFDTQVANVFVYRLRHHNDWPRYVEGLAPCLVQHLDLSNEEVNWAVCRERTRASDEEVWTERPVKKHLIEAAVKNVKHLLNLRQVLMEEMLEEFVAGVNIYLTHVKDASPSDSQKYQGMSHLLPVAFQDVRHFMSSYKGRNPYSHPSHSTKDMNGFRENCSGIIQPDVNFSRDSLWHGGSNVKKKEAGGTKLADMVCESKQDRNTDSQPTQAQVSGSSVTNVASWRNNHRSANSADDVLIKEMVAQMNSGNSPDQISPSQNQFQPIQTETSPNQSSDNNKGVQAGSPERDISELQGSSLMRALIQEQAPEGMEDKRDMNNFQILPAGKMVQTNIIRKTKLRVIAAVDSYDDLSKPISKTDSTETGGLRKCLSPQEMEFVQRVYTSPERSVPNDESDIFKHLKAAANGCQGSRNTPNVVRQSSLEHGDHMQNGCQGSRNSPHVVRPSSLEHGDHVQNGYAVARELPGRNSQNGVSPDRIAQNGRNDRTQELNDPGRRYEHRDNNLPCNYKFQQGLENKAIEEPKNSLPERTVSNRMQILMNLVKRQKLTSPENIT